MDKTGLIPIGRFAKLTDLSPRLLRRLDERGLLSPVLVDPETRYRYYDVAQTRVAGLIHLGRQLGLTVDQLADLFAAAGRGDLHCHLERQRETVAARLAGQSRLLQLLDVELARGESLLRFDVALKEVPAILVVSAAGSVKPDRHPVILYHNDLAQDDDFSFEVCFPVARRLPGAAGVACRELPAGRVAFTIFKGPYDTIWNAYVELHAWIAEHGYAMAGPVRETGILTDDDTDDPREWVTELAVPLAP